MVKNHTLKSIHRNSKTVYLDYASTTPVDERVLKVALPFLKQNFHNPSSLYKEGVVVKKRVDEARKTCADFLKAHHNEIFFTASGTEANNLIILGVFRKALSEGVKKPHIITTVIEHPSVLEVCAYVERSGGEVTYVPVMDNGIVDPREIKKALKPSTVLISVMYANNEIGTIQPIRDIAKLVRHYKKVSGRGTGEQVPSETVPATTTGRGGKLARQSHYPYFHTDASQAVQYCEMNALLLGVDFLTMDSSKIYAPKGTGLAYVKRGIKIESLVFGGGQENGLRAGTENVFGIIALAEALKIVEKMREKEGKRQAVLRDYLFSKILKDFPLATVNGDLKNRLPNNVNVCFPNLDAEYTVFQLDAHGIACSSVTSCKNLSEDSSSYVVEAIGKPECAKSSLRFTLGRGTTKDEINYLLKTLKNL